MKHPNALVGTAGGASLGPALVEILGLLGFEITGTLGAVIGGAAAGLLLLIGRKGFRGIARTLWHGSEGS